MITKLLRLLLFFSKVVINKRILYHLVLMLL